MSNETRKDRRWLKSVIAASAEPLPNFPWMRAERRRPQALSEGAAAKPAILATVSPRRVTLAAR